MDLVLEEFSQGLNSDGQWRNIQDVVRNTFRSLLDVVRSQSDAIQRLTKSNADLERQIIRSDRANADLSEIVEEMSRKMNDALVRATESRVSQQEFQAAMDKKANKEDVKAALSRKADAKEVRSQLDTKAETVEVSRLLEIQGREISDLRAVVDIKANIADVDLKASIEDVNRSLQEKANKASVVSALQRKANKAEVDASLALKADVSEVNSCLSKKADTESVAASLSSKPSSSDVAEAIEQRAGDVVRQLSQKLLAVESDLRGYVSSVSQAKSDELSALGSRVSDVIQVLEEKADISELRAVASSKPSAEEVHRLLVAKISHAELAAALSNKANVTEFENVRRYMEAKADARDVETIIQRRMSSLNADLEDVRNALERKATAAEVAAHLSKRAAVSDLEQLRQLVERKAEQGLVDVKADAATVAAALKSHRASLKECKAAMIALEEKMVSQYTSLHSEMQQRATSSEVERVVSTEVHRANTGKVSVAEFERFVRDQEGINREIATELCVGRWLWESGRLKSGHGVEWNTQKQNTRPDVFIWEADRVNIVVAEAGLYEVAFAFFAPRRPTVQLHVNGQPVLSAINSASYVVHHSSGRLSSMASSSLGSSSSNALSASSASASSVSGSPSITGLTLVDMIELPARARVALSYSGDNHAHGFLSLRKLI